MMDSAVLPPFDAMDPAQRGDILNTQPGFIGRAFALTNPGQAM